MRTALTSSVFLAVLALFAGPAGTAPAQACKPTPEDAFGPFGRVSPPLRAKIGTGHVLTGVVLSVGGFLGIGQKWVAVPMDEIELPSGDQPGRLKVAVTEEQLTNAPDFITREAVEAQKAAEEAQRQAMEQQQQVPPPAAPVQ